MRYLLLGLVLLSTTVVAKPVDTLASLLSGYDSLSGHFTQTSSNSDDSIGDFLLNRVDQKFAWHTHEPFPQYIISNGETIWMIDPDLEQVTVRSSLTVRDSLPAMLLQGRVHEVSPHFYIEQIMSETGHVFNLLPKKEQESTFSNIRLVFNDHLLSKIWLTDLLGQESIIHFSDIVYNPLIEPSAFEFTPSDQFDIIFDQ